MSFKSRKFELSIEAVSYCVHCSMASESQWGFDRTVTKKYGCNEMAYDPT